MNQERKRLVEAGLRELPQAVAVLSALSGRNGESLATDEAAVWKRVLNFRVAAHLRPSRILETHPGVGISTQLYRIAAPEAAIFNLHNASGSVRTVDIIDVDPFGSPWDTIASVRRFIGRDTVLLVSNGEAHAVRRNFKRGQKFVTRHYGKRLPLWVTLEYIPRLELMTGASLQFFYAFPTTVRAILAMTSLPAHLWAGCPRWMWWLQRYAVDPR